MTLRDTLKKAAGLIVELPPEETKPQADVTSAELDKLLAEINQTTQQTQQTQQRGGKPAPTKTVEQIVREAAGPNLDEIRVPASTPPPVTTPDGKVDFSAIYRQANLPAAPFTAEEMLEMLAS